MVKAESVDTGRYAREARRYRRDGYLFPARIIDGAETAAHRKKLEQAEAEIGPLNYQGKVHTILRSPLELATLPRVLDVVEALIGPNILLWTSTYIIKEPHTPAHVSWHQDLTYWGPSGNDQVSMWLALSPATQANGCMRLIPGSHLAGRHRHRTNESDTNLLFQGQTVDGVDESQTVFCALQPGQASFHHGWTLHSSLPNESDQRRIGLNAQYLTTHMRQTKHDLDTAMLVRGVDAYNHFGVDIPARGDLEPEALERRRELDRLYRETVGND